MRIALLLALLALCLAVDAGKSKDASTVDLDQPQFDLVEDEGFSVYSKIEHAANDPALIEPVATTDEEQDLATTTPQQPATYHSATLPAHKRILLTRIFTLSSTLDQDLVKNPSSSFLLTLKHHAALIKQSLFTIEYCSDITLYNDVNETQGMLVESLWRAEQDWSRMVNARLKSDVAWMKFFENGSIDTFERERGWYEEAVNARGELTRRMKVIDRYVSLLNEEMRHALDSVSGLPADLEGVW